MSKLLTHVPGPGTIVEFMQGNQPLLAIVVEESGGKLKLFTHTRRDAKLAAARLLPWAGPSYGPGLSREDMFEKLVQHFDLRNTIAETIDPMEIWELAQGEVEKASATWFAQLIFDKPGTDELAGCGRALLGCKTHFKFHPPEFEVYPAEVVERRLSELEAAQERERVVGAGSDFFQALWSGWASGKRTDVERLVAGLAPEAVSKLAATLRTLIATPDDEDALTLFKLLKRGLPDHPMQPYILATEWGIIKPHHNYLADQAGFVLDESWVASYTDEIADIVACFERKQCDPEDTPFVSIDSASTRDIDDAFYIEQNGSGGFHVHLALACPALCIDLTSPFGKAVLERATSIYLPEGISHMLPEVLGTDQFSLVEQQSRPALVLDIELSELGEMLAFTPRFSWVRIQANLTYSDVQTALEEHTAEQHLVDAFDAAQILRRRRLASGAVCIERHDPKTTVEGYPENVKVHIEPPVVTPMSQLVVSEFMILANEATALFAKEHGFPLLFRAQDVVLPDEARGVKIRPEEIHAAVKHMTSAVLDTEPGAHASLAVKAYCSITSPLRRCIDFINLAQMLSWLENNAPRWNKEELSSLMLMLNARLEAVSPIQRFRPRYWKLVHMQANAKQATWLAVVVEEAPNFITLSLPDFQIYVRAGREMLGEKIYIGQRFRLRMGKIDPLANEFRVLEASEEPDMDDFPEFDDQATV
ncbi:ribonuclease catalytic domain-containing protein [Desulfovibrio inopinatus]|uniref:ribonuclease catalytic domain-containing protein n=1 Tax=Desulfovibrio inopinatus TaxID=102109 RepID=UPI0004873DBD|nr:RNB domain-containing ribonuclease [Desulfovibrio inopinatus]